MQLADIEEYIRGEATAFIARRFVDGIVAKRESLEYFPLKVRSLHDLGPGLRSVPFKRRVTIVYSVDDDTVAVAGIFYRGQDIEARMKGYGSEGLH